MSTLADDFMAVCGLHLSVNYFHNNAYAVTKLSRCKVEVKMKVGFKDGRLRLV